MSYCRPNKMCDIYAYPTLGDKRIHVMVTGPASLRGQSFLVQGPMQALFLLLTLQRRGARVPSYALRRLKQEARAARTNKE